jgi:hypothetical protein
MCVKIRAVGVERRLMGCETGLIIGFVSGGGGGTVRIVDIALQWNDRRLGGQWEV